MQKVGEARNLKMRFVKKTKYKCGRATPNFYLSNNSDISLIIYTNNRQVSHFISKITSKNLILPVNTINMYIT